MKNRCGVITSILFPVITGEVNLFNTRLSFFNNVMSGFPVTAFLSLFKRGVAPETPRQTLKHIKIKKKCFII